MRARIFAVGLVVAGVAAVASTTRADLPCPAGFVRIPSGTFMMGSPDTEGASDEHPQHSMTVAGFCMQRLEVTVADYQGCVASGKCTPAGTDAMCNATIAGRAQHPINCVDWNQATAYCASIGARLPTEVEWEYAARGTDGRKYPWGNQPPNRHLLNECGDECASYATRKHHETKTALYHGSDGYEETAPVGSFPYGASPFGVLDMAGNVYEWTSSPYCYYPSHTCGSRYRMYRGGGWYTDKTTTAATRNGNLTTDRTVIVGIRCAK